MMRKLPDTIFGSLLKKGRYCYIPALLPIPGGPRRLLTLRGTPS